MKKLFKGLNILAAIALFNIWTAVAYYSDKLPDNYYVNAGQSLEINSVLDIDASVKDTALQSNAAQTYPASQVVELKLFGLIPIKDVEITSVETPVLVPGGTPFGIKLLMEGVMVVGMGDVECSTDSPSCPAAAAGIQKGDVILSIDGKDVNSNSDVAKAISDSDGESVEVTLVRDNSRMVLELIPVHSELTDSYQAGMWVRDSTAGIGTLTFYDPSDNSFGGLGHPICDVDTGSVVPVSKGEIVNVTINSIKKGIDGIPGELQGTFTSSDPIGVLDKNNKYGVFGVLTRSMDTSGAIPIALKQEIHEGDATILTTIDGSEPKEYSIKIEKIDYKNTDSAKNMIIKITDEELLEKTGGIVQGMSGSPIIQDGKLAGAVTHVFVSDPSRGYGIFAENMYELGL